MALGLATCSMIFIASPPLKGYADNSHVLYYASTPTNSNLRGRSSLRCQALSSNKSGGGGQKLTPRQQRVARRASQVADSLASLEMEGQLASYDLRLPGTASFSYETSATSSSSSSSGSSESEDDHRMSNGINSRPSTTRTTLAPPPHAPVASISVCQGKSCRKKGADRVLGTLQQATAGLATVQVAGCKCLGQCKRGPAVQVDLPTREPVVYVGVHGPESAAQLAGVVLPSFT